MRHVSSQDIVLSTESANIAVALIAVIYTKAFKMAYGDYFGLKYKAVSASGTPDVKIELEVNNALPTTEGAADTDWSVPEGMANIETNLITETIRHKSIAPPPFAYGRLKITGNAANPADTIVTSKLSIQEEF